MSLPHLCFEEDDFSREQWLAGPRWFAELADGRVVRQDDGRPGVSPAQAWLRLGEFVRTSGMGVRRLWLDWRGQGGRDVLSSDAEGYFFAKGIAAELTIGNCYSFYLIGMLVSDTIRIQKWNLPELTLAETEVRPVSLVRPENLIRNPSHAVRSHRQVSLPV